MRCRRPQPGNESEPTLPQGLIDDLAQLYGPGPAVPEELDQAIVALSRQRLASRRRAWIVLRRVAVTAVSAAAMVALVIGTWRLQEPRRGVSQSPTVARQPAGRGDLDRSGRVDILDAFSLARHLESRERVSPEWDVNRDGVVDQRDVDAVAMSAVSLKGGAS